MNDDRHGFPSGWTLTTINQVADVNPPGSLTVAENEDLVTFLPMASVEELTGRFDPSEQRPFGTVKKGFTRFRDGDLLFAKITPCMENGKIVVVRDLKSGVGCGSTEFHVIRPLLDVNPDYLRYFVVQSAFRKEARTHMQGAVGQQRVPSEVLREASLPLAPAKEQDRIVAKIDELFSEIGEGERGLERVQKLVERYRQSVLKAAVTGELTREWREKHKGKLKSGEALLALILKARRQAWEAAELAKMKAKGQKPTNNAWKNKYKEPTAPDTTDLPELPDGWIWASIDQLTSKITSGSRDWKDYYDRGDSVFVMAQNVRMRRFDLSEVQFVDPPPGDRDAARSEVTENDLLITIVGANTGDVCRVPMPVQKHYVCQSVALLRPVDAKLSLLMELYLAAEEGGQAQFGKVIYGAGRPHLSFDQLRATGIPVPGCAEQDAIANAIAKDESDLANLLEAIQLASIQAKALRQAALKSAFAGKLVPQDPADEPASRLLERIAAKRADPQRLAAPAKGRKKKVTT